MVLNINKCKELLENSHSGNIQKIIELLSRDDIDINYVAKVTRSTVFYENAITYAAAGGHEEIVKLLLDNGANANCNYNYAKSPLHQAIANGHVQAALAIIHHGSLNLHGLHRVTYGFDSIGGLAIRHALRNELSDVVIGLIQAGACTPPEGLERNWNLYREIISNIFKDGDVSVVKEIMSNHKDAWENDWRAAFSVCHHAKPEVVEEFIKAGGSFDGVQRFFSRSLLTINRDDPEDTLSVRKIFLEKICNVSLRDMLWIFPDKKWENISDFLAQDVDINIRGALGITPLMIAAQLADDVLVELMIKAGADITAINDFGGTALTMAVRAGNEKVVEALMSVTKLALFSDAVVTNDVETACELVNLRQIDVNHADENGKNALMYTCEHENLEMAEVVLGEMIWTFDLFNKYESFAPQEMCADINAKDRNGNTALANSCANGKYAAVSFLLEKGADVNSRNNDGDSALALSCKTGNFDAAKLLLLNGANINAQNAEGNTALMISCYNKDEKMVNLLVSGIQRTVITFSHSGKVKYYYENLLDVDVKNNAGHTALMLGYMGKADFAIINSVMSADPEDTGPFDIYGQKILPCWSSFGGGNGRGHDDWDAGIKKQRTALFRKDQHDERYGIDDQEYVQLLPLPDFLSAHSDPALEAVEHSDYESLSLACASAGHLL